MVSIKATVMAVMLLTVCVLATDTAEYHGCCRSYMKTKLPFRPIKGYTVQSDIGLCPISAIIFHTKKGRVCTDPALDWVMDYVNRLRAKAQMVHRESLFKE
ncbi:C-C motif chemokine 20-like [Cheilinus undulatus]|uniref:C-C motif chemokine 20-like n=1 Tax=Cheilinus undulatus TaxID=241271 RepID=UPI001BD20C20|nr:C-C motif chemokine 20-like [Cheilinus undulatus]